MPASRTVPRGNRRARRGTRHPCMCCKRLTSVICDKPLPDYSGRTCCRAICERCAVSVEHRNFCPKHAPTRLLHELEAAQ